MSRVAVSPNKGVNYTPNHSQNLECNFASGSFTGELFNIHGVGSDFRPQSPFGCDFYLVKAGSAGNPSKAPGGKGDYLLKIDMTNACQTDPDPWTKSQNKVGHVIPAFPDDLGNSNWDDFATPRLDAAYVFGTWFQLPSGARAATTSLTTPHVFAPPGMVMEIKNRYTAHGSGSDDAQYQLNLMSKEDISIMKFGTYPIPAGQYPVLEALTPSRADAPLFLFEASWFQMKPNVVECPTGVWINAEFHCYPGWKTECWIEWPGQAKFLLHRYTHYENIPPGNAYATPPVDYTYGFPYSGMYPRNGVGGLGDGTVNGRSACPIFGAYCEGVHFIWFDRAYLRYLPVRGLLR